MKKTLLVLLLLFPLFVYAEEDPFADPEAGLEKKTTVINIPKNITSEQKIENTSSGNEKNYHIQGLFHSSIGIGTVNPQPYYFNYNRLQLEMTQIYQNIFFKIRINARNNTIYQDDGEKSRKGENLKLDLTEAFVNYEENGTGILKQWNFVLGFQTVNWGKADEVRPTDIISPQDMTMLILEERNDRKLGRFGIKTTLSFGVAFRLEGYWFPIARASESTSEEKAFLSSPLLIKMKNMGVQNKDLIYPVKKLSHSDIAVKTAFQILEIDFALSFYNGYDSLPFSRLTFDYNNIPNSTIQPFLNRVTMWGLDFEKAFAGIGLRGEIAYFTKGMLLSINPMNPLLYLKHGADGLVEKKYLDATFGIDKNDFLIEKAYINLQYSYQKVFDYEEGILSRYGTKIKENNHSLIGNMSYEWGGVKYKIEIGGQYNLTHKDYLIKPAFHIKIAPETKMIFGAYFFGGKEDTLLGQYHKKDFGYVKLEHLF